LTGPLDITEESRTLLVKVMLDGVNAFLPLVLIHFRAATFLDQHTLMALSFSRGLGSSMIQGLLGFRQCLVEALDLGLGLRLHLMQPLLGVAEVGLVLFFPLGEEGLAFGFILRALLVQRLLQVNLSGFMGCSSLGQGPFQLAHLDP
jgi:hypothetical protein